MLESASAADAPLMRQHVGVVVRVGRQHKRDDLRLVAPARREQRTDRAIDHAAGEHFLLGGLAFALEEAAGDASRRVGVFLVVDRQRKKVDAFARVGGGARRDQDDRVAHADDDRAVGLLGVFAGFERKGGAVDFKFSSVHLCLGDHGCVCIGADGDSGKAGTDLSAICGCPGGGSARRIVGIFALQIVQQAAALADQLEETAARVMIFRVRLEVLGEIADAFAENGDLNFRGAGVGVVRAVRA